MEARQPVVRQVDEGPRRDCNLESLAKLKTVFMSDLVAAQDQATYQASVTAGNASSLSDGAAAVVLMSREKANELGCTVRAVVGAQASYGIDMKYVLVAPIWAIPKCLEKEGIGIKNVDLFEVNEAFSGSSVAIERELGLDGSKVNVNGGSVALGHPIGASGCRVLVTLIHEMEKRDARTGLASLCLGGGEAVSLVVRR